MIHVRVTYKVMNGHDAAFARLGWEIWKLGETCVLIGQTNKAKSNVLLCSVERVGSRTADSHSETLTSLVFNIDLGLFYTLLERQ
jgi:hypothetical protein